MGKGKIAKDTMVKKDFSLSYKDISPDGRWDDYLGWKKNEQGNIFVYEKNGNIYRICEVHPKSGRLIGVAVMINNIESIINQLETTYYWRGERIR